ncbi:helix-turn-helix domain-containing protein [Streptomyces sp. NPDC054961]
MLINDFHAEDIPPAERYAWWRNLIAHTQLPGEIISDRTDDFRARMLLVDFGIAHVTDVAFPSAAVRRTPSLIRRSDPESYRLTLAADGPVRMTHDGHQALLRPGDMVLCSSSATYECLVPDHGPGSRLISLYVPRALLPFPAAQADRLLGRHLPGEGTVAMTGDFLVRLVETGSTLGPQGAARLAGVALDLAAALVSQHLEAEDLLRPESRRQALLAGVHVFIERNLGDPQLSPAAVAAAHHISLSHLNRLFRERDLGVASWIRRRRLERCRRDLGDPYLFDRPVGLLAARWGFVHASDFTRAFRTAYGTTPSAYRRTALHGEQSAAR